MCVEICSVSDTSGGGIKKKIAPAGFVYNVSRKRAAMSRWNSELRFLSAPIQRNN